MDGPTISQPCIDFEPDERWHIKEEANKQDTSKGGKDDSKTLTEDSSIEESRPLNEVNGSAFECQGGPKETSGGEPKVNGELDTPCLMDTTPSDNNSLSEPSTSPAKADDNVASNEAKEESQLEAAATESSNSHSEVKMEVDEPKEEEAAAPPAQEKSTASSATAKENAAPQGSSTKEADTSQVQKKEERKKSSDTKVKSSDTTPSQGTSKPKTEKPSSESNNKSSEDGGEEPFVLPVDPGFPSFFDGAIKLGGYKPAKNIQKEFNMEDDEALLEAPSFVLPLLIRKSNVICVKGEGEDPKKEPVEDDKGYFGKSVGKFLIGLGLSRASECYQRDMTRVKLWQLKKEGKTDYLEEELAMHKNAYSQARIANEPFKFKNKKCEFCDFQTESILVMDHHYSIPHLNFRKEYKCNYCTYMSRDPKSILFHFEAMHGRRAILDLPIQFYQCPFCSFETHLKTKASSHINKCQKFYAPGRNQLPSGDFTYPALTAKPLSIQELKVFEMASAKAAQAQSRSSSQYVSKRGRRPGQANMGNPMAQGNKYMSSRSSSMPLYHQLASQALSNMDYNSSIMQKPKGNVPNAASTSLHFPPGLIITKSNKPIAPAEQSKSYSGRGSSQNSLSLKRPLPSSTSVSYVNSDGSKGNKLQGSQAALYSSLTAGGLEITPTTANSNKPIITIQPAGSTKANPPPPKLQGPFIPGQRVPQSKHTSLQGNSYVICEICDAYIKDLDQLRTHMQASHKIKIHPKMLANRPPLNCQKCHWRFFTDQGLERHLLGAHGLVTSNMQDMANKNMDGGRCTICGGIFACKLVAHMNRVHKVTLKPAHLSYKCTVCSTTFILYRLFENHVYTVHSGGNKRAAQEEATAAPPAKKKNVQPQPKPSTSTESSAINKIKLGNSISITVINRDEGSGKTSPAKAQAATPAEENQEVEEETTPPVNQRCSDCAVETCDIQQHLKEKHLKRCSVKLCRIEKCEKCLNSFDGMVVLHTSDLGLEDEEDEEESAAEDSSALSNKDEEQPVEN